LTAQIGHQRDDWPLVILKELVDNAIDACEEAGIAPVVEVTVDADGIAVRDNGPDLPAEVVEDVLDFSIRVSSREAYISPTRGAQGNALKTIVAMPWSARTSSSAPSSRPGGRTRRSLARSTGNWRLDALTALADARAEALHDGRQ
jgi:hypothetical protein